MSVSIDDSHGPSGPYSDGSPVGSCVQPSISLRMLSSPAPLAIPSFTPCFTSPDGAEEAIPPPAAAAPTPLVPAAAVVAAAVPVPVDVGVRGAVVSCATNVAVAAVAVAVAAVAAFPAVVPSVADAVLAAAVVLDTTTAAVAAVVAVAVDAAAAAVPSASAAEPAEPDSSNNNSSGSWRGGKVTLLAEREKHPNLIAMMSLPNSSSIRCISVRATRLLVCCVVRKVSLSSTSMPFAWVRWTRTQQDIPPLQHDIYVEI